MKTKLILILTTVILSSCAAPQHCYGDTLTIYSISPEIAMSKLMQLNFLSKVVSLNTAKSNALATNMYFLAQKKGNVFGPFGKLY